MNLEEKKNNLNECICDKDENTYFWSMSIDGNTYSWSVSIDKETKELRVGGLGGTET